MVKYFFSIILILIINACSLIEKVIEALPGPYKTRHCCYLNPGKDTIYFNCKNEKLIKLYVVVANRGENRHLLDLDTNIIHQSAISLNFIYNRISKDSLSGKYFHIIARSDKRETDYWFILDSADLKSRDTIFSYNHIRR